ncbi:hypothetical protein SAMN05444266_11583 [Chitinophaga jiangningensis]|uniref:DUF4870 domain-containing protein n=1 Tax=Chitinophaga jiangningensis TaxID=1419482 RepID=A0A1M7N0K0_9BACT|nr:DUF4870 domain-containing protein [Chitinophaga jiangningensis]SHM96453.1 hypothetical protein SAMN05444266_11583 [Chitinophaga jiangningensis]
MNERDERTWATLLHIAGVFAYIFLNWGWAGNIVLVLVLWLIKRNDSAFVETEGKEALNFQITISLASAAVMIISGITSGIWAIGTGLFNGHFDFTQAGFRWLGLYSLLKVLNLIFSILAAVAVNKGEHYRYPVCLRLVK